MVADTGPTVDFSLPEISHIAFVVDDLEDGMRQFRQLLGAEPWMIYRYEPPRLTDTTFRGRHVDYSMRVAFTDVGGPIDWSSSLIPGSVLKRVMGWVSSWREHLGFRPESSATPNNGTGGGIQLPNPGVPGVNVELIQPLDGPSTYADHLATNGTGIHHIGCFAYDDPYLAVQKYEDAGIPVIQSGAFEGLRFWYLDMTDQVPGLILEIAANLWAVPEPDAIFPE